MMYCGLYTSDKTALDLVPYTVDELKELQKGDIVFCLHANKYGTVVTYFKVRVAGRVKTWKTRPGDVVVPLRSDLFIFVRSEYFDGQWVGGLRLYRINTQEDSVTP